MNASIFAFKLASLHQGKNSSICAVDGLATKAMLLYDQQTAY
jgi:hypothetical protein